MKTLFVRLVSIALGGIFLYAGALKVLDPARFAVDVHNYRILPWTLSAVAALYLPWLEIVCGATLILLKKQQRAAVWILTGLMVVFLTAITAAKLRGIDVACGCFGSSSEPGQFWKIIARDAAILAGLTILLAAPGKTADAAA